MPSGIVNSYWTMYSWSSLFFRLCNIMSEVKGEKILLIFIPTNPLPGFFCGDSLQECMNKTQLKVSLKDCQRDKRDFIIAKQFCDYKLLPSCAYSAHFVRYKRNCITGSYCNHYFLCWESFVKTPGFARMAVQSVNKDQVTLSFTRKWRTPCIANMVNSSVHLLSALLIKLT